MTSPANLLFLNLTYVIMYRCRQSITVFYDYLTYVLTVWFLFSWTVIYLTLYPSSTSNLSFSLHLIHSLCLYATITLRSVAVNISHNSIRSCFCHIFYVKTLYYLVVVDCTLSFTCDALDAHVNSSTITLHTIAVY